MRWWKSCSFDSNRIDCAAVISKLFFGESEIFYLDEPQTLPHHLRRAVEKFRGARDVVQGQFPFVDRGGTALVWLAVVFRQRRFRAHEFGRHLDEMADGAARRREQFHPAGLSGVLPRELHEPVRARPHGQDGFPATAADQHALHRLAAAGGPGRVRQCALRRGRDAVRGGQVEPATHVHATRRLQRVVRGGDFDPLLADVHAGGDQLLDGARAGHRVWLLQPVQHRADAGRGV